MARRPLQHALDEIRFGPTRTLNLRASLPTAAEAVRRTDSWLRMKQAEGVREVLVITGRGNQSFARVPVVRESVRRLLNLLTTRGVVADHNEHSPGAYAVRLAPLTGARATTQTRASSADSAPFEPPTLDGLSAQTRDELRVLAAASLDALGVRDPSPQFVQDEMVRQCAMLGAGLSAMSAVEREQQLRDAIARALYSLHDEIM